MVVVALIVGGVVFVIEFRKGVFLVVDVSNLVSQFVRGLLAVQASLAEQMSCIAWPSMGVPDLGGDSCIMPCHCPTKRTYE